MLFAAIGLLSCLVTCIFPPPQICLECSVSVISCLLSDTAGQQRTPQLHAVTSRLLAAPEQRCSLMPRVVPYVALCVGPYSTARCLRPTRPTAQASFGPLHAGPMGAPSCHPQVLLKTSAAVVGVGGWNGIWWVATWSTVRAACVEWEEIRTWRKARRQRREGGIRLVGELSMSICYSFFLKHPFSWSSCSLMVNLTHGSHGLSVFRLRVMWKLGGSPKKGGSWKICGLCHWTAAASAAVDIPK